MMHYPEGPMYHHNYTPQARLLDQIRYCVSTPAPCTTTPARSGPAGSSSSPRSNHSGGVNVSMGDGSVRFVSNSIPLNVWQLPARLGRSPAKSLQRTGSRSQFHRKCRPTGQEGRPAFFPPRRLTSNNGGSVMHRLVSVLSIGILLVAAGCGEQTVGVQGRITLDQKPIDKGSISFEPADGNGTTSARRSRRRIRVGRQGEDQPRRQDRPHPRHAQDRARDPEDAGILRDDRGGQGIHPGGVQQPNHVEGGCGARQDQRAALRPQEPAVNLLLSFSSAPPWTTSIDVSTIRRIEPRQNRLRPSG